MKGWSLSWNTCSLLLTGSCVYSTGLNLPSTSSLLEAHTESCLRTVLSSLLESLKMRRQQLQVTTTNYATVAQNTETILWVKCEYAHVNQRNPFPTLTQESLLVSRSGSAPSAELWLFEPCHWIWHLTESSLGKVWAAEGRADHRHSE